MSRSVWLVCPLLICVLGAVAAGQKDPAKDTAVRQMRRIVNAIKQCPEVTSPLMLSENFATRHEGPPSIVDWDVVASDSLRSPLQGFVKFNVPIRLEETEEAKQSAKLDKKYREFVESVQIYEQENWAQPR